MMNKKSLVFLFLVFPALLHAQFLDQFNKDQIEGWFFFTGDGNSKMDLVQRKDTARILIDATEDQYNVWWAIIKNDVTGYLDIDKLKDPEFELRVEARVKLSHAPRRINFMINTQRTTNYHEHLREYDIADTNQWHVISMTTKNLDVVPGDTLYIQLGVTDWGNKTYYVDIDYYRADVVNVNESGPDEGEPLLYHPPVPEVSTFLHKLNVAHDALISPDFPDVNFNNWYSVEQGDTTALLSVATNQWAILRWDFSQFARADAIGSGLLELTSHSVFKGGEYIRAHGQDLGMEFGKVRIIEIFGGDPFWEQDMVAYNQLFTGDDSSDIINGQMVLDTEVVTLKGGKNYITLSRPVMQRLLEGKTRGLIIKPLGMINASFYASEEDTGTKGPVLYFNTRSK